MGWLDKRRGHKKKTNKGKATPAGQTSSPSASPSNQNGRSKRNSVKNIRNTAHVYHPEEVKTLVSKNRSHVVLGIDLGTTNCVMATIIGNSLLVIPDAEGETITPSIFALSDSGEYLTGWTAKRQATLNPQNTICSVKRLLACKYEDSTVQSDRKWATCQISKASGGDAVVEIGNQKFDPREVLAVLLRKMKIDAEVYLGQEVAEAVITIPAYFSHRQRQATKDAAIIAGFNVLRIISEPTAAALAYGLKKYENETVAICHLGGGTFDISILELGEGTFQVKSTSGDTHLGGVDFNHRVIDWICSEFLKEHGINLRQDRIALQRINEAVDKAKCELSFITQSEIDIPHITGGATKPKHLDIILTRSKLEQLVSDLIERVSEPCKQALSDAELKGSQIDHVILVGGQTKMPLVQQKMQEIFSSEGHMRVVPDDFVASGAAIHGGVLKGGVSDVLLLDVTPHTLGIETLGGLMTTLIPRNTTIPTAKSQVFSTTADDQTSVEIHVLQGEHAMAADNKTLGRFILDGILPAPRGVPQIEVTFDIDANGIVSVKAQDKGTGKERKITVTDSSVLHNGEMERMKQVVEACISTKGSKQIEVKDIDLNDIQNTVIQMPSVAGQYPGDPLEGKNLEYANKQNEETAEHSGNKEMGKDIDVKLDSIGLPNKYTSEQFGFEIDYPESWVAIETYPKRIHLVPQGTPKEFVSRPGVTVINIMVGEPEQPFEKDDLIESAKGPAHKPLGDYQVLSRTPFKVRSGDEGILFEFEFTIDIFSFRSIEGIIVKGKRVYSVEANTLQGNYGQYASLFKSIIISLYLK
jgi:molecular chaperone DnaK